MERAAQSTAPRNAQSGWLFGPWPDLMLGCGGLYVCVLAALTLGGADLRAAEASWLGPLLVLLLGAPHYGATIVRVYEQRRDRRAYVVFSLYATVAIVALFGVSLFHAGVASFMVTLYLSWSPWHYTGQNYGIAVMFLRRRGVDLDRTTQRWLYAAFLASFLLTIFVFHGAGAIPEPEFATGPKGLFWSLEIPRPVTAVLFPLSFGAGVVALGVVAVRLFQRGATPTALAPAAAMVGLQSLWFSLPFAARQFGWFGGFEPFQWDQRAYFFFWIALGHSTQYLWITAYTAREAGGDASVGSLLRFLGKILLAGTAVWTLPTVLLDPHQTGIHYPELASLTLLVASAVNLHHFVLDGAIWKLRKGRIADILIRRDASAERAGAERSGWGRPLVWAVAVAGCLLSFGLYLHQEILFPRAVERRDFAAARRALDRVGIVLEIAPGARAELDRAEAVQRARQRASDRRLEQQLGIAPDIASHLRSVERAAAAQDWSRVIESAEAGLGIDPESVPLLRAAGRAAFELGDPPRARCYLERAVRLEPWDEATRRLLARLPEPQSG